MENTPMRALVDAGAGVAVAGVLAKALPPLAAAFALIWYVIQIWQSETGKLWRGRWKRLFSRQMTMEDRVAFVLLVVFGGGALAGAVAFGVMLP